MQQLGINLDIFAPQFAKNLIQAAYQNLSDEALLELNKEEKFSEPPKKRCKIKNKLRKEPYMQKANFRCAK